MCQDGQLRRVVSHQAHDDLLLTVTGPSSRRGRFLMPPVRGPAVRQVAPSRRGAGPLVDAARRSGRPGQAVEIRLLPEPKLSGSGLFRTTCGASNNSVAVSIRPMMRVARRPSTVRRRLRDRLKDRETRNPRRDSLVHQLSPDLLEAALRMNGAMFDPPFPSLCRRPPHSAKTESRP